MCSCCSKDGRACCAYWPTQWYRSQQPAVRAHWLIVDGVAAVTNRIYDIKVSEKDDDDDDGIEPSGGWELESSVTAWV